GPRGLARPFQRTHRIAARRLLQDPAQVAQELRIDGLHWRAPTAQLANPPGGGPEQGAPRLQFRGGLDNGGPRHARQLRESTDATPANLQGPLGDKQPGLVLVQSTQHPEPGALGFRNRRAGGHARVVSHAWQRMTWPFETESLLLRGPLAYFFHAPLSEKSQPYERGAEKEDRVRFRNRLERRAGDVGCVLESQDS